MSVAAHIAFIASICAAPLSAQGLVFSDTAVRSCIEQGGASCIGAAATACMKNSPGGESTVGMGGCLDREVQVWDEVLNAEYQRLVVTTGRRDAEGAEYNAPATQPALRNMQRAWIEYRDATCDFERSKWGGGTRGGPATLACIMRLTAQQALYLSNQRFADGG